MIKVEVNAYRDTSCAAVVYGELCAQNEALEYFNHNNDLSVLVLFGAGQHCYQPHFTREEVAAMSDDAIREEIERLNLWNELTIGRGYRADNEGDLREFMTKELTHMMYFSALFEAVGWSQIAREADIESRGYNQGEAVAVFLIGEDGKARYKTVDLDRVLWESPVGGYIVVWECTNVEALCSGEIDTEDDLEWQEVEFIGNLDEFLEDGYTWDREKFLENFEREYEGTHKAAIVAKLIKALPEHLEDVD